jgi:hypothetical protein
VLDEGIPGWMRLGYPTEGQAAESEPIPHTYPPGLEPPGHRAGPARTGPTVSR